MSRTSEACHVDDQKNLASEPVQGDQVLLVDIVQGKVVHSCVRLLRVSAKVVISDPRFGSHQPRQQGEADCFGVHHCWAVQRRLCPMSPALSSSPKPYPNLGALVCSLTTSLYIASYVSKTLTSRMSGGRGGRAVRTVTLMQLSRYTVDWKGQLGGVK